MKNMKDKKYKCRLESRKLYNKGLLKKPDVCEWCKNKDRFGNIKNRKLQMHHENYDYPEWVVWLCGKCHMSYHMGGIQGPRDLLFPDMWVIKPEYNPLFYNKYRELYKKFKKYGFFEGMDLDAKT